ncbi:MAG: hypothetical protein ACREF7_03560 [Candidatus Saccharimonadales bacterium]
MKNPNKQSNHYKRSLKTLAAASALALTATGVGATIAGASTRPQKRVPVASLEFKALTKTIAGLDQGKSAHVAENNIALPGPINEAQGRPLVIEVGAKTYLAYSQDAQPNFDQKRPADVAGEMAIVQEPKVDLNMPLESAHLNKSDVLVDEDQVAVGFSSGGDLSGK